MNSTKTKAKNSNKLELTSHLKRANI